MRTRCGQLRTSACTSSRGTTCTAPWPKRRTGRAPRPAATPAPSRWRDPSKWPKCLKPFRRSRLKKFTNSNRNRQQQKLTTATTTTTVTTTTTTTTTNTNLQANKPNKQDDRPLLVFSMSVFTVECADLFLRSLRPLSQTEWTFFGNRSDLVNRTEFISFHRRLGEVRFWTVSNRNRIRPPPFVG